MRRCFSILGLASLLTVACQDPPETNIDPIEAGLTEQIDPAIGTGGLGFTVGSITPAPTMPFGLAKPAPDTSAAGGGQPGFSHCAGYYWEDDEIRGFSQIHLSGTGVPDYGALGIMPSRVLPEDEIRERDWRAEFDHRGETISTGRYGVDLLDRDIHVEVRATEHTALYRFEFAGIDPASVFINLDHYIGTGETTDGEIIFDGDNELSGWLLHSGSISNRFGGFKLYYVFRFDHAPERVDTVNGREITQDNTTGRSGAILRFGSSMNQVVNVQVGLSFVDLEGARKNLDAEWMDYDLGAAEAAVQSAWQDVLRRIVVEGATETARKRFYTAVYHIHQMPTAFTDVDDRYRGFDDQIHTTDGFRYYSDFSLWDTFRTTHPFFAMFSPSVQADMNRSLLTMRDQGGHLPRWALATGYTGTMIGNHGETMLIDSYLKGVGGFDVEKEFDFFVKASSGTKFGSKNAHRECWEDLMKVGYCIGDTGGAVSRTLENGVNDWALSNLARALGHEGQADSLLTRAQAWRMHWHEEFGFVDARMEDGSWAEPVSAGLHAPRYTEGNARQWSMYPYFDLEELTRLVGGTDAMIMRLEQLFAGVVEEGEIFFPSVWYWHGNEPNIHIPYFFALLGRPDLTQKWVRWIMDTHYQAKPDGFDGNDDGGTLSAWYVFSALGFYPWAGSDQYVLGAPRFEKATMTLENGKTLTVRAEGFAEEAIYVEKIELDGERLTSPVLRHSQIADGGELVFTMSKNPSASTF